MIPQGCWLFLLISLGILKCSKCGERWKAWDDHVQSRIRRDTSNSWQDLDSNPMCTLTNIMTHDALGRRASNKLLRAGTQGNCGSCWAFAITHAFADHLRIKSNPEASADFSQDHLTKCNPDALNGNGCCGSDFESAFEYLQEKGFAQSSCLPYRLQEYPPDVVRGLARIAANSDSANMEYKRANPLSCPATCNDNSDVSLRKLPGFSFLITEEQVMTELDNGGPVIAAVRIESGSPLNLLNYRCGVFVGPSVSFTSAPGNHAVEIVDYSRPYDGPSYWVVKNTFGPDWGESGYVRIARGRNQFQDFYALDAETASSSAQNAPVNMNPASLCGAQPISNIGQNMLVQEAAKFGISAIQNRSLIVCSAGNNQVAELELVSIINATQQIIQGFILDLDVQARARCDGLRYPAIISYSVLWENNMFSLGDFNYDVQLTSSSSPKLEDGSYFMLLILAVVSLFY